nr:AI-2E family transporter [Flavimobilis marinus]
MRPIIVPPSVQAAAAWSWRLIVIAAAVVAGLWVLATFKTLTIPVAVALLFTVLLAPLVRLLHVGLRFPRALASGIAVLGLIGFVAALITLAGASIVDGISDLSTKAQEGFQQALDWLAGSPFHVEQAKLDEYLGDLVTAAEENMGTLVSGALSVTTTVGQVLAGTIIALFCAFFFLLDGRRIWTWVVGLLPRHVREDVHQAGRRGIVTLASYVRTQILVAFVDAVGIGVGAAVLGLPLAFPLATLVFVGSFIPFVGAIATGAIAVAVALVVKGWVYALIMLGIVLLVQQIEGNVLQPFLMGHAVSLHPVAVLLVVTGGAMLAGIVGALFAVPVVAVLNTVIQYFHGKDKFPDLGIGDHLIFRSPRRTPRAESVDAAPRTVVVAGPTPETAAHVDALEEHAWRSAGEPDTGSRE